MTTVFTADPVEYTLVPEKYATDIAHVQANINVLINKDWQTAITTALQTDTIFSADEMKVLVDVNKQHFEQNAGVIKATSTDILGGGGGDQTAADAAAVALVQKVLYAVASSYWDGSGSDGSTTVNVQLKTIMESLITLQDNTANSTLLSIDQAKVDSDLALSSAAASSIHAALEMGAAGASDNKTSTLSQLVTAYNFAPVLNRWIAGGLFHVGTAVDGQPDPEAANQATWGFDTGTTAAGDSNFVADQARMVFPVNILVADDSAAELADGTPDQKNTTGGTGGAAMEFNMNIIFQTTASA